MNSSLRPRIIRHPFASLVQGGRLDSYDESKREIKLEVQGLHPLSSRLIERNGKLYEHVRAKYVPLRLTFSDVSKLQRDDFFMSLDDYGLDDSSRTIAYMYSWLQPKKRSVFYMFGLRKPANADMQFFARNIEFEIGNPQGRSFVVERDWSPAPPMPGRLVPQPKALHQRFGGDPITIHLNKRAYHRKLFISGIDIQPKIRPQVDAVLNLGEKPSRWVEDERVVDSRDRAIKHGEGHQGMTVEKIREEAEWVIERLKANQRVLIHCVAGMNRSTSICCAVLILLEGLSADDAITRIREHHPWARPDSHHWLALRWLARTNGK